ncbi:MAG: gamma-glutamylcyclotransferase [Spirulinaceae cyanobacterium SM2_1_0]|nr:gamma-glutamylcyclotransferase [Spirulinaceae cyanobacterium SM2_1_0]
MNVFVYGTLKPGECNYADCAPWVVAATPAWTRGELYALPLGYPALTEGDRRVEGVLLQLRAAAALEQLDALEDYDPARSPAENEYERRYTPIFAPTGAALGRAWAYWMTRARIEAAGGQWLPSGYWSAVSKPASE